MKAEVHLHRARDLSSFKGMPVRRLFGYVLE